MLLVKGLVGWLALAEQTNGFIVVCPDHHLRLSGIINC